MVPALFLSDGNPRRARAFPLEGKDSAGRIHPFAGLMRGGDAPGGGKGGILKRNVRRCGGSRSPCREGKMRRVLRLRSRGEGGGSAESLFLQEFISENGMRPTLRTPECGRIRRQTVMECLPLLDLRA